MVTIGYKPQQVCELIGVGSQTLRYWREHLRVIAGFSCYSAGDLLALRVINVLISKRGYRVEELSQFALEGLVEACNCLALPELAEQYLVLDATFPSVVSLVPAARAMELALRLEARVLPLAETVAQHQDALLHYGNRPTGMLRMDHHQS